MDAADKDFSGIRLRGEPGRAREPVAVPSIDTRTGRETATVEGGGAADAATLVDAGAEALDEWRSAPGPARAAVLRGLAARFREAADGDLPSTVARETGKRLAEAETEFRFSAQYFDVYARLAEDRSQPWWPATGGGHVVHRHGVGVAGVVTPWNFPVSIPARKIAPALAAGCTVVWKPSEVTPVTSSLVAALVDDEVPAGVLGMALGSPEAITGTWLDDPRVRVLSFTGSTRVGRIIAERAAGTFTRTVLELGGQAPFVILDDADIEAATACLFAAKFRNNGQSCIAANRVWAPQELLEDVAAACETRLKEVRVGDPLDPATALGPLALPTDPQRLNSLVEDAEAHGARVVRGAAPDEGHFAAPAMCVAPGEKARMLREEVFGPVFPVSPYRELTDALDETNALPHGLAGYVCTSNPVRGLEVAECLDVGVVGVNTATPNLVDAPFGGRKESGWGYEGGPEGLEPFLAAQMVAVQDQP